MTRWPIAVFAALLPLGLAACSTPLDRHEFTHRAMGTQFKIIVFAPSPEAAKVASDAAFDRIDQLNGVMSDYDERSELMRLSATSGQGKPVSVSDDLWDVLSRAKHFSQASDGAFDITVGPVVKVWRLARRFEQMPPDDVLADAVAAVGHEHIRLNERTQTVELTAPGMSLDLGGIAKGYACDAALRVLREHGLTRALVDGGGDMVLGDAPPPDGRTDVPGWRVGVAPTGQMGQASRFLSLSNVAVATSGDAWQHVVIDGVRYSHIVDPKTGLGLTDQSGVTIVAPDGTTADALASAVSVLGPVRGMELVEATPGVAAFIVRQGEAGVEVYESQRMKQLPRAQRKETAK